MKQVNCAKCGKPEMVPVEQATEALLSREKAEQKLSKGESATVLLCKECSEAFEAFRSSYLN